MEVKCAGLYTQVWIFVTLCSFLLFQLPVTDGQCSLSNVQIDGASVLTDSRYMWWTETERGPQELAQVFSDSSTCIKYVRFGSGIVSPSAYVDKEPCERCVSSITVSNNGIRYVGERTSLSDQSKSRIYCNELFPSNLGNIVIQREDLKEENVPGSVSPNQCQIESGTGKWIVRTKPGDLSLTQTADCPFDDGSYRMVYGYNGNRRCPGGTNQIATFRVKGSTITLDASDCEDYVTDRINYGYVTTDNTKDYRLPLSTNLVCATGSEFPGTIMGRSDAGNLLLLADLDPPVNLFLKRPWYYACNYEIIGTDEIFLSCSTDQTSPVKIRIDPAQTPQRLQNTDSDVLYFTLIRQNLDPACEFPSQYERDWFYRYIPGSTDIVYEQILNSVDNRRILRGSNSKPTLSEETCVLSTSESINSGTYNYYVFGEIPGELTCYAYLAPTSSIQDKVLIRYETTKGIFSFATETTCRDYMTNYNENTDFNKVINLRVLPRIYIDNYRNGITGTNPMFGDWTSYSCPFSQEGSFQLIYSESESVFNVCAGDESSYAVVNGNGIQFKACGSKDDNTYQKPYNAIMTCIANWDARVTGHLPPGQGKADEYTTDHYLVLAMRDLNAGPSMRFYCARYREVSDKIYLALNVDSESDILCRTDVNAEAYESSSTGNIRQFTLTKTSDICQASPCQNDGTCTTQGNLGKFTCKCHGSYKGDLCATRYETLAESDVTRTITIIIIVFLVLVAIIVLALLLREYFVRKNEKKQMDTEYGRGDFHRPDNISTISADPKSNVSLNGSNVQAWFPDYRQNEK